MLESLARKKRLAPTATLPRCRSCAAFGSAAKGGAFEFPCRPTRAFLPAEKRVAEHSGYSILPAQKMHLESMGLFFRARLSVDAADIRFRIGI